ncbi:ABC transporter permease [Micromonospora sp. NBC_01796]|uniref:ABC transporter permease n=1 Tax=Micromonospora sp. NBC_01796 TaxID=2975987 RepID=UPI002DDA195A|nr:ABC transporter permease [Micromonospora sp. NBC_01796]WSA83842.1 ABC transporter permease [Micromonospora sp. NBC_01796]
MIDALAAEWIKIRTTATTLYCLGVALGSVVLSTLLTFGMVSSYDGRDAAGRATFSGTPMEEITMLVAHLCLGVLGVLVISSEYTSGMIRTSFIAMPSRRVVFLAKSAVVGFVVLVAAQAVIFGTFFLSRLVVGDRAIPDYRTGVDDRAATLFAMGLTAVVVALVGLGLAAIFRSAVAAIAGIALLVYVFPIAAGNIPEPVGPKIDALSMRSLALQIGGDVPDAVLTPAAAVGVLVAYVVVAIGTATHLIGRRDA